MHVRMYEENNDKRGIYKKKKKRKEKESKIAGQIVVSKDYLSRTSRVAFCPRN